MLLRLCYYVDDILVKPSVRYFQRTAVVGCNSMRSDAENSAIPETFEVKSEVQRLFTLETSSRLNMMNQRRTFLSKNVL